MATYKFNQFNSEITDPTITVKHTIDHNSTKTCDVEVELVSSNMKCGVILYGFSYESTNTWSDADILAWVNIELQKYKL